MAENVTDPKTTITPIGKADKPVHETLTAQVNILLAERAFESGQTDLAISHLDAAFAMFDMASAGRDGINASGRNTD